MAIGEDFRFADISLVKDGPGFKRPTLDPAASVLPLSLPGHASPDINLPVIRDVLLLSAAGSVSFKYETGCVFVLFVKSLFLKSCVFRRGVIFFPYLFGFPGLFLVSNIDLL